MKPTIRRDSTVLLEYTLNDGEGNLIDSNRGEAPLEYTHGWQELIPGVERALEGKQAGQQLKIEVPPEEGYGPVDPTAEAAVPKDLIPPDALRVGAHLNAKGPTGEVKPVRVKDVTSSSVILDLNHPLAGRTLYFDIRILSVEPAKR